MLSYPDIDDEEYEEIIEDAISTVTNIYSEWTDFNAHDPGVTILELFALTKESQQFFASQISQENRRKYLKLLGVGRRTKAPARSLVKIRTEGDYLLLKAHRIEAGNVSFETLQPKQLVRKDVRACLSVSGGQRQEEARGEQLEPGRGLRLRIFGSGQETGCQFYVCLEQGLPVGVPLDLYLEISKDHGIRRNPVITDEFVPLVELQWQYYSEGEWKDLGDIRDETYGLLFDGFICFTVGYAMEETVVMGETGYFLRAVLVRGAYDTAPVLTAISMNICRVIQRETLVESVIQRVEGNNICCGTELAVLGRSEVYIGKGDMYYPVGDFHKVMDEEEGVVRFEIGGDKASAADCVLVISRSLDFLHRRVLGEGDGFPCQEIDLEDLQILCEDFAILIQDAEEKEGYRLWHRVEDFAGSAPEDRHYVLDSQRGRLCFGDCLHGMAPEGEILLAGYARTRGNAGNVRKGVSCRFCLEGLQELETVILCEGSGGRDEETLEDCFLRAVHRIKGSECAVAGEDYERYVRQTPGLMIESCQVLSLEDIRQFAREAEETAIHMVVKPYRWQKRSRTEYSYRRNIERYLEHYRMIGSPVILYFPEYVEVQVYVEAVVKAQYLQVEERVREIVGQYMDRYKNAFGSVVSRSGLYGFIDSQNFVIDIRSLSMDIRGNGAIRNADGDILLSPYGIAILKGIQASLTMV